MSLCMCVCYVGIFSKMVCLVCGKNSSEAARRKKIFLKLDLELVSEVLLCPHC